MHDDHFWLLAYICKEQNRQTQSKRAGNIGTQQHAHIFSRKPHLLDFQNDTCQTVAGCGRQTKNKPKNIEFVLFCLLEINGQYQLQEHTDEADDVEDAECFVAVGDAVINRKENIKVNDQRRVRYRSPLKCQRKKDLEP